MKHVTAKVVILTIVVAVHILVLWLLTLLNRQPEMTARDFQEAVYIRDSKPPELQTPVDPMPPDVEHEPALDLDVILPEIVPEIALDHLEPIELEVSFDASLASFTVPKKVIRKTVISLRPTMSSR